MFNFIFVACWRKVFKHNGLFLLLTVLIIIYYHFNKFGPFCYY